MLRELFPNHPYLKYYTLSLEKGTDGSVASWQQERTHYTAQERYEIPKVMIWNYLFWETNYDAAGRWLDTWWSEVKKPGVEDWMTKSLVQVMTGQQEAAASLEAWLAQDPESQTARFYLAFLNQQYTMGGRLKLQLPGYKDARVVTVGGLSANPNYYLMHPTAKGWEIMIDTEPGYKPYYFLVDGKKILDPQNPVKQVIATVVGPQEVNLIKVD